MDFTFHFMDRVSFLTGFWRLGESMDELNGKLLLPQPENCCPCFSGREEKRHLLSPFGVFSDLLCLESNGLFCVSDLPDPSSLLWPRGGRGPGRRGAARPGHRMPHGGRPTPGRRATPARPPGGGAGTGHQLPGCTRSRARPAAAAGGCSGRRRRGPEAGATWQRPQRWSARRARRAADDRSGRRRSRARARGATGHAAMPRAR